MRLTYSFLHDKLTALIRRLLPLGALTNITAIADIHDLDVPRVTEQGEHLMSRDFFSGGIRRRLPVLLFCRP